MVASDGLPKLGQEMLTGLLVGRSLPGAIQVAREGFSNGYHSELRQPVIAALEDVLRNYRGICTPVIGADEDKPCSVLVIDDDENFCKAMRWQLERLECRVREATSGMDGLQLLRQETPDLILLDLVMPEMNGIQFLELLREAHPDLPVVIVTGYSDSELMKQATQYAPLMLLAKPVEAGLLERTVRTALAEKMSAMRSAGHLGRMPNGAREASL